VVKQLRGKPLTKRDRPLALLALRRVWPAADLRLPHAERGAVRVGERDVPPAQAENLAAAQAGRDDRQKDDARLLAPGPLLSLRLVDELSKRPFSRKRIPSRASSGRQRRSVDSLRRNRSRISEL
jgi:hypothetical protein